MMANKAIWTAEHVIPYEGHFELFVFERAWDAFAKRAEIKKRSFGEVFVRRVPLGTDVLRHLEWNTK